MGNSTPSHHIESVPTRELELLLLPSKSPPSPRSRPENREAYEAAG